MITAVTSLFNEHPHAQNLTYLQHAIRALSLSAKMGKGCLALLIHAVFPMWFQSTGTRTIRELYDEITPTSPPPSPSAIPVTSPPYIFKRMTTETV